VDSAMTWYDITSKYHEQTFPNDGQLDSLSFEWQRELAALWRLEADVNNGAYLQFLVNWGRGNYVYASRALKKIGALKMAAIIDQCQALVDEHFDCEGKSRDQLGALTPEKVINVDTNKVVKAAGSILPEPVTARILELSYEFMDYPDDVATLGLSYYRSHLEGDH
jgi:hypothetical protein